MSEFHSKIEQSDTIGFFLKKLGRNAELKAQYEYIVEHPTFSEKEALAHFYKFLTK